MSVLIVIIHILVCLALIGIVLLQAGKGADIGAAFGAGSSQTMFGTRGAATFLQKATVTAAITFMVTSLALTFISNRTKSSSVVKQGVPGAPGPRLRLGAPSRPPRRARSPACRRCRRSRSPARLESRGRSC
jgi:preprotein translocase subunit SecG